MPQAPEELIEINVRRQVHLERNKSHEIKAFEPFLVEMSDRVQKMITRRDFKEYTQKSLQTQLKGLEEALLKIESEYKKVWIKQIKDLAESDVEFEANAMRQVTELDFTMPSPDQVESAIFSRPLQVEGVHGGKLLKTFFNDVTSTDIKRISNEIRIGFAQGLTTRDITSRVREITKTAGRSAEMLTRTALAHSSNQARQALYERNKQVVKALRWTSTLDSRTTTICKSLSGRLFPLDSGPRPPVHPGCRSIMTAAFDERFSFLRKGATQSSRGHDGVKQVDADLTYYSWLKTQNKEFQESAIGVKWTKLLRDGEISSERFAELRLNKKFEPITLDEAKALEPVAFRRADL